jgi:heat shock 70kDa protein 4
MMWQIEIHSKRGARLLAGCERMRKLLSQLVESQITVEHLIDERDIHFSLRREELSTLSADLLTRFQQLVQTAITSASANSGSDNNEIAAIEVLGGGLRMPIVQQALLQGIQASSSSPSTSSSLPLGAKLDDGSVALGAALLCSKSVAAAAAAAIVPQPVDTTDPIAAAAETTCDETAMAVVADDDVESSSTSTLGLTVAEIDELRELEDKLRAADEEVQALHAAYNALESFILEMRSAPRSKHGQRYIADPAALQAVLDEAESWLWDNADNATTVTAFVDKLTETRTRVGDLCSAYFEAVEQERREVEAKLQAEADLAEAERANNNDDENDDHDNRKLKKADRLRLVNKNKEEGNELFAGGNYRMAMARYHKAVTHSTKFFDLSPEDTEEIKVIQVALYCNLATCYSKVENHEQMLRNCEEALKLNDHCLKALFRRSQYYEHKKEYELALQDLKKCVDYNTSGNEDKLVTKATDRVKREMQKEKDKEKKMWGKAFG